MPYKNPLENYPGLGREILHPNVLEILQFKPKGRMLIDNPYVKRSMPRGRLRFEAIIGLTSGYGKEEKFKPEQVRELALQKFPDGGTIILQLGWWGGSTEDSVRLIIFNMLADESALPDKLFRESMEDLAVVLASRFRQSVVPVFFFRGSELEGDPYNLTFEKE